MTETCEPPVIRQLPERLLDAENMHEYIESWGPSFVITLEFCRNISLEDAKVAVIKFCETARDKTKLSHDLYDSYGTGPEFIVVPDFLDSMLKYHVIVRCGSDRKVFYEAAPPIWKSIQSDGKLHFCQFALHALYPLRCEVYEFEHHVLERLYGHEASYLRFLTGSLWHYTKPPEVLLILDQCSAAKLDACSENAANQEPRSHYT
ncbi:MAG: hypothetical protein MRY32_00125 [Rickettsiales bacterium]|nr:hypothetical protein [Rickettsiales bacterium]